MSDVLLCLFQSKITYQKLEAQEVQSPNVIESNFKNMQSKLKETKQQLEEGQQTLREKKKTMALYEVVERDIDVRLAVVTEIVSGVKSAK